MRESQCCVCGKTDAASGVKRCDNPGCTNSVCEKHALRYELHDEVYSRLGYYCSRQCWSKHRQRSLPLAKELFIAAVVLLVVIPLYLYVVKMFV